MKARQNLPENYREIFSIDLQKNKKIAVFVNVLAVIIMLVMAVPMHFHIPISSLFDLSQGFGVYFLHFGVLIVAMIAYIFLHELVHGITMKLYGTQKVKYGFTGMYAFAGSDDYYDKKSYLVIALAPIVVWGIVFAVLNILLPYEWFWVIYILQIINISGGAGDLYVTVKFARLPKDILITDCGVGMTVYSAE